MTNIFTFDPEMIFSPHFHFKAFPEKERERERERESVRARERRRNRTVSRSPGSADLQSELQAVPISSPSSRQRNLAKIAAKIAISRRRDIAISDRDRKIAPSRARASDRDRWHEIAPSRGRDLAPLIARLRSLIAIVDGIFLGFVFSSFFSKH